MSVLAFKDGALLFRDGRLWFITDGDDCCAYCPGSNPVDPTPATLPSNQPTCVTLHRTDFPLPGGCATGCSGASAWNGSLAFDGTATWQMAAVRCTVSTHRFTAKVVFTSHLFTLTVYCADGTTVVWQGTKNIGDTPCGRYTRTSGDDTSLNMQVS
jgi:hypothetical protein